MIGNAFGSIQIQRKMANKPQDPKYKSTRVGYLRNMQNGILPTVLRLGLSGLIAIITIICIYDVNSTHRKNALQTLSKGGNRRASSKLEGEWK